MAFTSEEVRECTMIALDQPLFWVNVDDSFEFTIIDRTTGNNIIFNNDINHKDISDNLVSSRK